MSRRWNRRPESDFDICENDCFFDLDLSDDDLGFCLQDCIDLYYDDDDLYLDEDRRFVGRSDRREERVCKNLCDDDYNRNR